MKKSSYKTLQLDVEYYKKKWLDEKIAHDRLRDEVGKIYWFLKQCARDDT